MDPNTVSAHFSIRDNGEDQLADQGTVVVPKTKGWRNGLPLVREYMEYIFTDPGFREHVKAFFKGGEHDR